VSAEPKAKHSASSYLNISWVQHIDILTTAQGGIVSGRRSRWTRTLEESLLPNFLELRKAEVLRMRQPVENSLYACFDPRMGP
jgi:hypothetical protein